MQRERREENFLSTSQGTRGKEVVDRSVVKMVFGIYKDAGLFTSKQLSDDIIHTIPSQ